MPRLVVKWGVPLALVTGAVFYYNSSKHKSDHSQPLKFEPSGQPDHDSEKLEHIREDWKERNQGIGLRDVNRSGGGV
ncbi:predicted protein [Lichtheimia corymbifera JMRC:FSU:9682]|uniref:Uncharacterized protein n=1 Tax=Lichtheimia corymbifera JMRC:FSU:9682 TaxID=1263082 RepID=A0A068RU23_9FUNG|nr:predicted protein [Lichtheimia corymbifera JMRC:FSU:9682]